MLFGSGSMLTSGAILLQTTQQRAKKVCVHCAYDTSRPFSPYPLQISKSRAKRENIKITPLASLADSQSEGPEVPGSGLTGRGGMLGGSGAAGAGVGLLQDTASPRPTSATPGSPAAAASPKVRGCARRLS